MKKEARIKNKNKIKKTHALCRGFTLVELLVAMAIFSIIALASVAAFGSSMQSQRKTREIQSNVAAAKTALDLMAKNMRMSQKLDGGGNSIHMYNNSQDKCIEYKFDSGSNSLKMAEKSYPDSSCSGGYGEYYTAIISGATGSFKVIKTNSPNTIGKATVSVKIGGDTLQTSVSFRDYQGSNIQ